MSARSAVLFMKEGFQARQLCVSHQQLELQVNETLNIFVLEYIDPQISSQQSLFKVKSRMLVRCCHGKKRLT